MSKNSFSPFKRSEEVKYNCNRGDNLQGREDGGNIDLADQNNTQKMDEVLREKIINFKLKQGMNVEKIAYLIKREKKHSLRRQ